jgi:conjugative relaxase-like TrwC/TraI family protein
VLFVARVTDRGASYYLDDLGEELRRVAPEHAAEGGRWIGRGTDGLGLAGAVDGPAMRALLSASHPRTGRAITPTQRRTVAAFDLTFTAPKRVSLLLCLGDRALTDQVLRSHHEAVHAAVDHLERRAWAVRRGSGDERAPIATSGMVAARFTHCLSRAGDPHVHTHVVAANLAHGADGRWSALDSRGLFAHARAAGALYDAHLRAELTDRLGLSWSWGERRGWDVAGADPVLVAAFSNRSAEIRQELAARGTSSKRSRHVAWASTRDPKDREGTGADVAANWTRRASVAPRWRIDRVSPSPSVGQRVDEYRFQAAIEACPPSGVCRRDVVAAWSDAVARGSRVRAIEGASDHWVPGDKDAVGVAEPRHAPGTCVPAPHLIHALGPRPATADGQPVWQRAAAAIDRYRQRWGVERDTRLLGTDRDHLAGLPHRRLADHLEVSRTVREALVSLGGDARARLEHDGLALERR